MSNQQPDPDWIPISESQLTDLIQSEETSLDNERRALWEKYRVPLAQARINRSEQWGEEQVFVVARSGDSVLFYDDGEDEFATGTIANGLVTLSGYVGELRHAISIFHEHDA